MDIVRVKLVKSETWYGDEPVTDPESAMRVIAANLKDMDREFFVVLCMDAAGKVQFLNIASIGTVNQALIHPREIYKPAVLSNSSSVILAHNHPSGSLSPSPEDLKATELLMSAGKILGIEVNDHIIIGGGSGKMLSMRREGLLPDLEGRDLKQLRNAAEPAKSISEKTRQL